MQPGVFKLQVLATNYSGFQFLSINTKVLPHFVTSLYSGEMCSVGLQVNFNHYDTPDLLNAALFSSAWHFYAGMTDNIHPSAACLYVVHVREATRVFLKLDFSQVVIFLDQLWILGLMTERINE